MVYSGSGDNYSCYFKMKRLYTILNLNFQRTGVVSTSQIKRIGELASVNYILVTEAAVLDSKKMFITAKLLEVETASTIMVENMVTKMNVVSVENACVSLVEKFFLNPTMSTSDVYLPSTTKVSPNSALSLVSENARSYHALVT